MLRKPFRPQLEELGSRILPSANPAISISDVSVVEGDSGQTALVFTVSLSKASRKEVSVNYATVDVGSATAGSDYVPTAGKLTFAPGQTTKTISVLVNGDMDIEPDEWFTVNLSNASRATIMDASGIGSILMDDWPTDYAGWGIVDYSYYA